MNPTAEAIRGHRLRAHHLDRKIPPDGILRAAGACGLQNSPPGAWETALFNRLEGCAARDLRDALVRQKILLQAWSYRGVPVVFPTGQSGVFLSPLIAREGEQPWIYTRGITAALDFLGMTVDGLLPLVQEAAKRLDARTITSKEALDQTLAALVRSELPREKRALWDAPSMYGNPDRQTVGGAAVSFLLRPCSFMSLVVFGDRPGGSPAFTSFRSWLGREPDRTPDADRALTRKFLHCYGPATANALMEWLGCSPRQANRLWNSASDDMRPVRVEGKIRYMLADDMESLRSGDAGRERLILLGAHDPYLDLRDKAVILERASLHKAVWRTVANPGVILKRGRVVGTWTAKTTKDKLDVSMAVWESVSPAERRALASLAEEYAAFRLLSLRKCDTASG